jgi:phosphoserine aminotransferase
MGLTTMTRTLNFSAGPAILPEPVLESASRDLFDIDDSGIGIMEHSHRGPTFSRILQEAIGNCRAVGDIPEEFEIVFVQGGASMQFAMIPMNFLPASGHADYIDTGSWASKAAKEANRLGDARVIYSGQDELYRSIPTPSQYQASSDAAYLHYCTNNTIYGTRFHSTPASDAPVIADMSSDMFSRPIDWSAHDMVYAGAQKNLGPAGVVLLIIRREFLATAKDDAPTMLQYRTHVDGESCYNTPPTFGIYIMGEVFKWIMDRGGLDAMASANDAKAGVVYQAIDDSAGFYSPHANVADRSVMNVTFTTPSKELDAEFLQVAGSAGMSGLKGHRSIGGLRASIYNAFPAQGCDRLAEFMTSFAASHR